MDYQTQLTATPIWVETWNLKRFEDYNLPEVVTQLQFKGDFSRQRGMRVLDLCIKTPTSPRRVPSALNQFMEAIWAAARHEVHVAGLETLASEYVYITVDQEPVDPGVSQRREGWHSDAYIVDASGFQVDVIPENVQHFPLDRLVERTNVAFDALPTLFAPGPFPLQCDPDDYVAVQQTFDRLAWRMPKHVYPTHTLLALNPYCVHASAPNTTGRNRRTFVKIQFSFHRYNRVGNSRNPEIDYSDWTWVSRDIASQTWSTLTTLSHSAGTLPTVIGDDEGFLKPSARRTKVTVYKPAEGEKGMLYEMGISVVETGDSWHVNLWQKVPLNSDRDNVTPSYLQKIRTTVLNHTAELSCLTVSRYTKFILSAGRLSLRGKSSPFRRYPNLFGAKPPLFLALGAKGFRA